MTGFVAEAFFVVMNMPFCRIYSSEICSVGCVLNVYSKHVLIFTVLDGDTLTSLQCMQIASARVKYIHCRISYCQRQLLNIIYGV